MAKKYVHPDQLAVLVVGNEKDFEKPLSTLGTVTTIDVTDLPPGTVRAYTSMSAFHDGPPGRHWTVSGDRNPRNPIEGPVHQLLSFDID